MTPDILIVDDDPDLRETLQLLLEDCGYHVDVAENGRVALDHLRADAHPRLILLDLMMPEMSGWEFLDRARADRTLSSIPIVVMTAHRGPSQPPVQGQDVLYKPFTRANLLAAIERRAGVTVS
jgi:CheY-like chemotaxis protein